MTLLLSWICSFPPIQYRMERLLPSLSLLVFFQYVKELY